jgi:hypothetical protein
MLLLFWYLPLILFSGACETFETHREPAPVRVERHRET